MVPHLELVTTLEGHKDRVWSITWSPDGEKLASCSSDKTICIWGKSRAATWLKESVLDGGHNRTIRCVAWSPTSKCIASASFDATTCLWQRQGTDWELAATLEGHENEVKAVSWSASGVLLASCSRDKSVWIWEVQGDGDAECLSVLHDHTQDVKAVAFHPFLEMLASCSYDDSVKLYAEDDDDWECFDTLRDHKSTVWAIDWERDGNRLASVSDDRTVKIWRAYYPGNLQGVPTGAVHPKFKCVCTLSGHHSRPIYSISWSRCSGRIATGGGDDCVVIFEEDLDHSLADDAVFLPIVRLEGAHSQDVNCVAWNPVEKDLLASCSDDGSVKIWRLHT